MGEYHYIGIGDCFLSRSQLLLICWLSTVAVIVKIYSRACNRTSLISPVCPPPAVAISVYRHQQQ